jgi:hypothetical protein
MPPGVHMFFHGGGYCSGSILSHRRMVSEAGPSSPDGLAEHLLGGQCPWGVTQAICTLISLEIALPMSKARITTTVISASALAIEALDHFTALVIDARQVSRCKRPARLLTAERPCCSLLAGDEALQSRVRWGASPFSRRALELGG